MHVLFLDELLCESGEHVFSDALLLGKVCSRPRYQSLEAVPESSHFRHGVDGHEKEPNRGKFSF